tara:strand:- start:77 stop:340 length:264 start_codon:yes stop_codon:yes gene_type:complete
MSHIKLIKSEQEHSQAMSRLMSLMDLDSPTGSAEADEIEVLALLIESYEKEAFRLDPPSPLEAILFRMDQNGLKEYGSSKLAPEQFS